MIKKLAALGRLLEAFSGEWQELAEVCWWGRVYMPLAWSLSWTEGHPWNQESLKAIVVAHEVLWRLWGWPGLKKNAGQEEHWTGRIMSTNSANVSSSGNDRSASGALAIYPTGDWPICAHSRFVPGFHQESTQSVMLLMQQVPSSGWLHRIFWGQLLGRSDPSAWPLDVHPRHPSAHRCCHDTSKAI